VKGQKEYILTVDPLSRPSGFLVLRGREYLGQRAGLQLLPDVLRSTSADKLDHMLAHTPIAHYTTDPFGRLEYVNPAFEQLAGYTPGEMTDEKLAIPQLLQEIDGRPVSQDYTLGDHQGKASLRRKNNASVAVTLFQYVIRDDTGKIIGASGSILSHGAAS
jgi:PAS domain S-box-containing protein